MVNGDLNCTVECSPHVGPQLFDVIEAVLAAKTLYIRGAKRQFVKPDVLRALSGELFEKKLMVEEGVFDQSVAKKLIDTREY